MRKLVKQSLAFCLLLSMLFSMAKPALAAGGIKQKQLSLYTGQSAQLTLTGVKGKATWTTSNKKVATVSVAGNVKGVAKGNATITARVGKASFQCKVTVKDPSISAASKTLTKGGKFTLSLNGTIIKAAATSNNKVAAVAKTGVVQAVGAGQAKITLTGTNNKKYVCTVTVVGISQSSMKLAKVSSQALSIFGRTIQGAASSNTKVATVSRKGVVKAVGVGKATITLTGNDKKKYTCAVTVTGINRSTLKLTKGGTFTLSLSNTSISTAATSNSKVATVTKKGVVKAVGVGKATITLTDPDKKKYTCAVTVTPPPFVAVTSVTVLAGDGEMTVGDSQRLETVIAPNNATNKALTWSSSDSTLASVDDSGLVTALLPGTVVITAAATDGSGVSASCQVTVESTSVIVGSVAELEVAAADGNITEIVLASNTSGRMIIPEGVYEDKELVVDVPNGEVENNANWKQITIKAISPNTYIENTQGNTIFFAAPNGTLTLTELAQATISVVGDAGSSRSLTVIDNSSANLVSLLRLLTTTNLTITGNNNNLVEVNVDQGAQGSQVETTKKVSMTVRAAGVRLVLESGGEDSSVTASTADTVPVIQGQGRIPVDIVTKGTQEMIVATNNGSYAQGSVEVTGSVSVDGASTTSAAWTPCSASPASTEPASPAGIPTGTMMTRTTKSGTSLSPAPQRASPMTLRSHLNGRRQPQRSTAAAQSLW